MIEGIKMMYISKFIPPLIKRIIKKQILSKRGIITKKAEQINLGIRAEKPVILGDVKVGKNVSIGRYPNW